MRPLKLDEATRCLCGATALLFVTAASSFAQTGDVVGNYSTDKSDCKSPRTKVTIGEHSIDGENLHCRIGDVTPSGTGLATYDATCTYAKDMPITDPLTIDAGNYDDHIQLNLPGKGDEWIALYPCK